MSRPVAPASRRIDLILAACLFSLYLLFLPSNPLTTPDEEILLRTAVSFLRGDRGAIPPLPLGFATQKGRDGREYAQYGIGLPLASAPFLLAPALAASSARSFSEISYSAVTDRSFRLCGSVFNLLVTVASVVVLRRLLTRLGLAPRPSAVAALVFGTATIAWPHGRTFFTEPLASLCLLLAVDLLSSPGKTPGGKPGHLLLAGVCFGWAILTRLDSLVAAPAIAWELLRSARRLSTILLRACLAGLPVALAVAVMAAYNIYRFGGMSRTGYEDQAEGVRFATPLLVGLHGYLLTPGRSVFVYSPVLLLAIPGAAALWRRDQGFAVTAALVVAGYLGVMGKWQNWAGGSDWGPRHIFQITPWLMMAAAVWWFGSKGGSRCPEPAPSRACRGVERRTAPTNWVWLIVAVSVCVQMVGLLTDAVQVIRDANLDGDIVGKNMSVYDPARCTFVLHVRWLLGHMPNLLLAELAAQRSGWIGLFVIPLCTLLLSIRVLVSWFREIGDAERPAPAE